MSNGERQTQVQSNAGGAVPGIRLQFFFAERSRASRHWTIKPKGRTFGSAQHKAAKSEQLYDGVGQRSMKQSAAACYLEGFESASEVVGVSRSELAALSSCSAASSADEGLGVAAGEAFEETGGRVALR